MTEQIDHGHRTTPSDMARQQWEAAGSRRSQLVGYVLIAGIALAIGAAGALLAVRWGYLPSGGAAGRSAAAATTQSAPAAQGTMPGMENMPGMAMESETPGEHPTEAKGSTVYISPARQQLIGVRTARVDRRAMDATIRTVGTLAYDETRVTQLNTKIAGWVEKVFVDYVGKTVRRGEPLFTVYSPELVATQNEYLLALKAQAQLGSSQIAETRRGAASLVEATRERLKLWDITDTQVADLERTHKPQKNLTVYSPFNGIILERNTFAGQYITPEMAAVKIADLSTIWVVGQVFEYELSRIRLGQVAEISFPYGDTDKPIKGRIGFIYPDIDPQTRRARIRVEFPNPGLTLKPGSYVTVTVKVGGGEFLALPKEALIDTGTKRYAILAHPNGYFEPREVQVGEPVDEFYPLLSGLQAGDQIVTSAQFLVDSETNLQAAMQAMSATMPGMDMGGEKPPAAAAPPAGSPKPPKPPDKMEDMPGMEMPAKKPPAKPKGPGNPQGDQQ